MAGDEERNEGREAPGGVAVTFGQPLGPLRWRKGKRRAWSGRLGVRWKGWEEERGCFPSFQTEPSAA